MEQLLSKPRIIEALLLAFKEVKECCNGDAEVLNTSKPADNFDYIDSEILLQVTGMISAELKIEIPAKCQLFIGTNKEPLTIEEVADKLLELNLSNGSR